MNAKPHKLKKEFHLSGLGGAKNVTLGVAPPEQRMARDHSKEGIPKTDQNTFDDYKDIARRWGMNPF